LGSAWAGARPSCRKSKTGKTIPARRVAQSLRTRGADEIEELVSDIPFGFGVPPEEPDDDKPGKQGGSADRNDSGKTSDENEKNGGARENDGNDAKPANDPEKRSGEGAGASGGAQSPFGFGGAGANPLGALFGGLGGLGGLGGAGGLGGPGGQGGDNPLGAFGNLNPSDLGAAFQQLGQMLSGATDGGPVNWDLARDIARQAVVQENAPAGKDRSVSGSEKAAVDEALRLAELWLDDATAFPSSGGASHAWSRAEWIEGTLPAWKQLVDPVADRVAGAMGGVVPEEMQAMVGPLLGVMRSMGGAMFGTQIGQALGGLAGEVVGSTDVGLPLTPAGQTALLPQNIAAFSEGLSVPEEEVRFYLALREAAHQRLFSHVPWLRAHLFGAVEAYARGISVDTSRLEDLVGQIDPSNPEALQEAMSSGMFQPQDTPEQKAALARLETALALVEGWVDAVVHNAAAPHLPHAEALRETLRRRRATGGPAEQTFATLVGLELRPRRLRDASRLWASLADARGTEGRDGLWAHPDMLPTASDLDDPDGFVHREDQIGEIDFDKLLRQGSEGDGAESTEQRTDEPEKKPEDPGDPAE
jgi:putative hydrolase